jgi:hypothetical protein
MTSRLLQNSRVRSACGESFGWRRKTIAFAAALVSLLHINPARATLLSSWTWTSGTLAGEADFSIVADAASGFYDLQIVLTNTATAAPSVSSDVLSGLYFDVNSTAGSLGALSMISAAATGGTVSSTGQTTATAGTIGANICAPGAGGSAGSPTCAVTLPGGWEAAYNSTGFTPTLTQHYAIGTTGQTGTFIGNSSTGTGQLNYAIMPSSGVSTSANGGVSGNFPYVLASATLTLGKISTNQITISHVAGAYGTAPEATPSAQTTTVPEPGSLAIIGAGLIAMFAWRHRSPRRINPSS